MCVVWAAWVGGGAETEAERHSQAKDNAVCVCVCVCVCVVYRDVCDLDSLCLFQENEARVEIQLIGCASGYNTERLLARLVKSPAGSLLGPSAPSPGSSLLFGERERLGPSGGL